MNMHAALRMTGRRPAQDTEDGADVNRGHQRPVIGSPGCGTLLQLARLRRPRLLVQAARHLAREAPRGSLARRTLKGPCPRRSARLGRLFALEAEAEDLRREGAPAYSARHHVELLAAILQEAPGPTGADPCRRLR